MRLTINFINEETQVELLPTFERQNSMTSIIRSITDDITEKLRAVKRCLNQDGNFHLKTSNIKWKNTMNSVNNIYVRVKDIARSLFVQEGVALSNSDLEIASMDAEIALLDVLEDDIPKLLDNLGWEIVTQGERNLPVFAPIDVPGRGKLVMTPVNQPTTKPGGLGG
ncbi:hypothetical protein GE061_004358 [Apolygus lucorum]|uniref:Uncharacterized protein n=1 Tax=Apolygus lucorum TaxID=248454 RepID=A0A6A4J9C4_APOLU|nr:hypothetical protein GE061_004358 [Apolygus lucorum]